MDEHKALLELQDIDTLLDGLHYREKNLPERDRYQALLDETNKTELLYKTFSKKLHDESAVQKRLEDELATLNAKVDKDQKRLYSGTITSPKELTSVQHEIDHLKGLIDDKELVLLEQIEVVDGLKSNAAAVERRLNTRRAELDEAKKAMEAALAEIRAARAKLQAKREPIYASLGEDTRQLYDRVRTKHPLAVTVLEEGICLGCRVEIPSTDAARIDASSKLERCPNCTRIIVKK